MPINCSMGIMAHNEEANIGRLLEAVISQTFREVALTEIVVVASGCTDDTEAIVLEWAKRDSRDQRLPAQSAGKNPRVVQR